MAVKWHWGILGMILLAGCKSGKVSHRKVDEMRSDTLILKQEIIQRDPLVQTLRIRQICDTITGVARDFESTLVQGDDTLGIRIQDGDLIFSISQLDSIKSRAVSEYRATRDHSDQDQKEVITNTITPRWAWISLGVNVILVVGIGFWIGKNFTFSWAGLLKIFQFWK
jgi:hypothetical protein